jgi:hypothetical protein
LPGPSCRVGPSATPPNLFRALRPHSRATHALLIGFGCRHEVRLVARPSGPERRPEPLVGWPAFPGGSFCLGSRRLISIQPSCRCRIDRAVRRRRI